MMTLIAFTEWMKLNTNLSESSIYKYTRAINTISNDMFADNIIAKSLFDMNSFDIDIAVGAILHDEKFIAKNLKGKRMYSNSLKQFRYCIVDNAEYSDETIIIDDMITERISSIKTRVGQGIYRQNLMEKYNGKCVITGIDHPKLLVASHIKPWSVCDNNERTDTENGLLLSANMDRLFDCGLITFNNTGKIFISTLVGKENEIKLNISKQTTAHLQATSKLCEYLDYHRDVLFVK